VVYSDNLLPEESQILHRRKVVNKNIFREYDIRGVVGTEIDLDKIPELTNAILTYFLEQSSNLSNIIVGMDGRTHSPTIKDKIIEAATKRGINVTDIGLCPTPALYFSLFETPIAKKIYSNGGSLGGLMITASHNPKDYNGIKICLNKKSVWGTQIKRIKEIFYSGTTPPTSEEIGTVEKYDIITHYVSWLAKHFSHLKNLNIDAVIDCGNGTGGSVIPQLVKAMGWKNVKLLYEEVDGTFPNHEPDPTTYKNMKEVEKLLKNKIFSVGVGLDGDCDRMNPMTKSGYLVPGDQLLALYAKKVTTQYQRPTVVFDIKSSDALIEALNYYGAIPCISPSGHSIIKENLQKNNAKLAGEISCHFFFNDRYFGYDDAIYAALRLFELLQEGEDTLDEMIEKLPQRISSPEYRIDCEESKKQEIVDHVKQFFSTRSDVELLTIDGIRASMPYGWGLVRASNTQPVICLRFESNHQEGIERVQRDFIAALQAHYPKQELKTKILSCYQEK
jgi:phosphomannomutase/phosphoglucomutase